MARLTTGGLGDTNAAGTVSRVVGARAATPCRIASPHPVVVNRGRLARGVVEGTHGRRTDRRAATRRGSRQCASINAVESSAGYIAPIYEHAIAVGAVCGGYSSQRIGDTTAGTVSRVVGARAATPCRIASPHPVVVNRGRLDRGVVEGTHGRRTDRKSRNSTWMSSWHR